MGWWDDHVVPRLVDVACGMALFDDARRETCAALRGTVLEIGFGSGLNLPYMPATVTRVLAVDPCNRARDLAGARLARSACPVEFVGLDASAIQVESASADSALCTFTLCTLPDPTTALREVRRILKPGGCLHVLEHGRAPDAGVRRWQDRLNGMQRALCGGCNLNRDIGALLREAGFAFEPRQAGYVPSVPRTHGYVTRAMARA